MTHKNLLTLLRLVVMKQQHYSTPTLCSVAFQNDSMIALALKVINTNAGPAIVVTTASNDELINLG